MIQLQLYFSDNCNINSFTYDKISKSYKVLAKENIFLFLSHILFLSSLPLSLFSFLSFFHKSSNKYFSIFYTAGSVLSTEKCHRKR